MKNESAALLESVSLRRTQPRLMILEVLMKTAVPLTQDQIADKIGPDAPNKTTIYRTLTNLVEKELVHEAFMDNRTQYYELGHRCGKQCCHPHFTCSRCKQTQCLTEIHIPVVTLPADYTLRRQQIYLEGICSKCKNTQ